MLLFKDLCVFVLLSCYLVLLAKKNHISKSLTCMFCFAWHDAAVEDPGEITVCQESPIDLTFLIDGSDSIDREDFDRIRNWTLHTIDAFEPSTRNAPLFLSVVQFSERSQVEVQQQVVSGASEVAGQIENIVQMRSGTKTYSALAFVNRKVYPTLRPKSFKILITMTDGDASEVRNEDAINQALKNFDVMVAVGVGRKIDRAELEDFSSHNLVITVENFNALEGIISRIIDTICSEIDGSDRGIISFVKLNTQI